MSEFRVPLIPLPPPWERKHLRKKMGISIADAAGQLGVSARTYSRWEHGANEPNPDHHRAYRALMEDWEAAIRKYGK